MNGCGASTQNRWLYGQADGFFRHQRATAGDRGEREQRQSGACAQLPAKPIECVRGPRRGGRRPS